MDVEKKNIVITGGAQGIGFATAWAFAEKGSRIAIIDFNGESAAAAVRKLKDLGTEAIPYICDVTQEEQVVTVFENIVQDMGCIHGLINNAGIIRDGLLIKSKDGVTKKMPLHQWQAVIDTNLTGTFLCAREAAFHMQQQGNEGVIVNISSISKAGNFGQTNYSAAKAGVAAMVVTWAKELAKYGIRSCAIAPGFIMTEMTAAMPPETLEKMAKGIPVQRMGQPEEIAKTALMIFENDYLNGRVIEVDGGLRI